MMSVGDADLLSMDGGRGGYNTNLEDTLQTELEFLLQARRSRQISDREKDLNIHRYGSAPPTVEGSLSAVGGLFGSSNLRDGNCWTNSDNHAIACEDEIRSHPAYLSYYYSRGNVNPRLPPPALSKEDWRVTQRFQVGGGSSIGDLRDLRKNMLVGDGNGSSLFSMQPGGPRLSVEKAEDDLMELRMENGQASTEWPPDRSLDRMSGLPSSGLGFRKKSFADILQEGPNQYASLLDQPSRPQSHNALADMVGRMSSSDSHAVELYSGRIESMECHLSGTTASNLPRIPSRNTSDSHSLASFGASLSRNRTPEPQLIGGPPGNGFPPVDSRVPPTERKNAIGSNIRNGCTLGVTGLDDVAASFSGLSFSDIRCANQNSFQQPHLPMDRDSQLDFSSTMLNGCNQSMQQFLESNASKFAGSSKLIDSARKNGYTAQLGAFETSAFDKVAIPTHGVDQVNFPKRTSSSANLYSKMASSTFESLEGSDDHYYQCGKVPNNLSTHLHGGLSGERKLNAAFDSYHAGSAFTGNEDGEFLQRSAFEIGNDITPALLDPAYVQYLQNNFDHAAQAAANTRNPSHVRDRYGSSAGDLEDLRKAYLEALLAQQKQHYGLPLGKPAASNHRNQGNLKYGHLQYPGNAKANSGIPSVGYENLMLQDERIARFTSMMRSSEASISPWSSSSAFNVEGKLTSSLLDEFKNNKTRSFELSDISGHVVEFSSDQYGSRFIQQKLETASEEEKNKIFPEIMPHARTLMTDVFGNYVIQKFFEHGTESQRKELASQLTGHVLPLSLQMYGCRVIQKALEVVDVEQQTQMVAELDGSVMKCVRDQNGNHVIQKCIECVPQNQIQFIISAFYGQVVALSMHPYGCRVIQRVLEYSDDPSTQQVIMDEIMQSVITLAQDQYGNYVIQHVLEHGKSHERSAIVNKLAGQIVRMSQQKFASNVIEKCLTFGSPEERQILIQEIIGFTDENEPLQAMMRDPFGNYVVQKVLETCDDRSLEFILSRIKVHLNTLKRYTYGKHIVSRVEKLITTGERRIGMSSAISSGVI